MLNRRTIDRRKQPSIFLVAIPIGALVIIIIQSMILLKQGFEIGKLGRQLEESGSALTNLMQADQNLKKASDQLDAACKELVGARKSDCVQDGTGLLLCSTPTVHAEP